DDVTTDDVVVGTVGGRRSLSGQDAEQVAVKRRRRRSLRELVAFGLGGDDEIAVRARRLVGLGEPVQTVALARRALELLRILEDAVAVAILLVVLALRVDVGQARLHRVELVAADAPRDDLVAPLPYIEPPALAVLDDGDRERPV